MNRIRRRLDAMVGSLSISSTIILGFLVIFLPIAIVVGWYGLDRARDSMRESTEANLTTLAGQVKDELERALIRPFQDIQTVADNQVIRSTDVPVEAKLTEMMKTQDFYNNLQRFYSVFLNISLVDLQGSEIVSTGPDFVEKWDEHDWFEDWFGVASTGRAAVSPPHQIGSEPGDIVMSYAAPVRTSGGEVFAVLVGQWNMATVWAIADGAKLGERGRTRVIDANGTVYAHPDKDVVLTHYDYPAQASALSANATTLLTYDEGGEKIVAGITGLDPKSHTNWYVLVSQPYDEAFGSVDDTAARLLIGVVAGSALFVLFSLLWIRRAMKPVRALSEGAERIGAGELAHRVAVSGPLEVRSVATSFNDMAENLERAERIRAEHVLLRKLQAASLALASAHVPRDVIRIITNGVQDILSCDAVWVSLVDEREEYLETRSLVVPEKVRIESEASGKGFGIEQRVSLEKGDGFVMKTFMSATPLFLDDLSHRKDLAEADPCMMDLVAQVGLSSLNFVPLALPDRNLGLMVFGKTTGAPLTDEEKRVVLVFAHEATISLERARLRIADQKHAAELSRLNDLKSRLLHILSHELKTPLTSLRTSSRLLHETDAAEMDSATRDRLVENIVRATNRLMGVADDIYPIAGVLTGSIKVERRDTDCRRLVDGAVEAAVPQTEKKNQTVNVSIDPAVTTVHADRDRLKQVLAELITNASKFSPDGSSIDVLVHNGDTQVKFEVRDRGIGVSEEDQKSIFDGFYRADSEVVRRAGGKGLGLLFVRTVVERHRGKIAVDSTLGEGSTFRFAVPARGLDYPPPPNSPRESQHW